MNYKWQISLFNLLSNKYLDGFLFQMNFPLCTIAHTPRLPEHCIEWVRMLLWSKESPFNAAPIDGDDPAHINWILEKAQERACQFNITGVTYRLTQVKRALQIISTFSRAATIQDIYF